LPGEEPSADEFVNHLFEILKLFWKAAARAIGL
jgi:hypothetical protein